MHNCSLAATRERKIVSAIDSFIRRPRYIGLVSLLTLASSVFSLEIPLYFLFIAMGIYICLFSKDLLGLMPLTLSGYMSVSKKNNPGVYESTIFSADRWGIVIIGIAALLVIFLIWRLCTDDTIGKKAFLTKKRTLMPSLLILGAAYCLGGLGTSADMKKNLVFALLQFATLFVPYYVFSGGVDWKNCRRDYFCWIGFFTGLMLILQLVNIYRVNDILVNGIIDRDQIYNGWSTYNNFGMVLAMMIPCALYLASRHNKGWLGSIAAVIFLVGTFFSCSRNSILMGCIAFTLSVLVSLSFAKNKRANFWALVIFLSLTTLFFLVHYDEIHRLFAILFDIGADNNGRFITYREGLKQFAKHPIFGSSFYPQGWQPFDWSTVDTFTNFFPPRWHNTIVQLLASTGIVGLATYLFHRARSAKIFMFNRTREKAFIACMMLTLLGGSMLDCHFFNIGPVLFYSVGLAFAEFCVKTK